MLRAVLGLAATAVMAVRHVKREIVAFTINSSTYSRVRGSGLCCATFSAPVVAGQIARRGRTQRRFRPGHHAVGPLDRGRRGV